VPLAVDEEAGPQLLEALIARSARLRCWVHGRTGWTAGRVEAFHACLGVSSSLCLGSSPVKAAAGPWSGSFRTGYTTGQIVAARPSHCESTRLRSSALASGACSTRSTTRSTFYLVLPVLTLTAGFPNLRCLTRTTLGFQPPPDYGSGAWGFEPLAAALIVIVGASSPYPRTVPH
jgi:hypothetical protein